MDCRPGCAACCCVISISSPIPGMKNGKAAGERCIHLSEDNFCKIHNSDLYPEVCRDFKASKEICGETDQQAFLFLEELEKLTKPY